MRAVGRCVGILAIVAAVACPGASATAESWPLRTVRFIVPIGTGSTTDTAARLFADRLADRWKQPVVVENRPGADGQIGVAAFVGMHDDHALLYSFAAPLTVLPMVREKLPYDPERDLVPIAAGADTFGTVSVAAPLKVGSLAELVALARSAPGKLNCYAGSGSVRIAGLVEAAARRHVPLAVLDVDAPDARELYAQKLVLVRPDQHVAWRGDDEPAAPGELIDLARGARMMPTRRAA